MYILEDIWAGKLTPADRVVRPGSPYQKISHENTQWLEQFRKELSPEGKHAFDEYYNTQMSLCDISETDAFVRGVRLGAKFILDVMEGYPSQLPSIQDESTDG